MRHAFFVLSILIAQPAFSQSWGELYDPAQAVPSAADRQWVLDWADGVARLKADGNSDLFVRFPAIRMPGQLPGQSYTNAFPEWTVEDTTLEQAWDGIVVMGEDPASPFGTALSKDSFVHSYRMAVENGVIQAAPDEDAAYASWLRGLTQLNAELNFSQQISQLPDGTQDYCVWPFGCRKPCK